MDTAAKNVILQLFSKYAIKCNIYFLVMEYFGHMDLQFFLSTNRAVSEKIEHTILTACYYRSRMFFKKYFTSKTYP
jgi:hypothetical protein